MLRGLALLTLTSRQMGPVSGSVFPLALGSCRGAPGSHFHQGNHTHFPTDLLRKMLHQSRTLPRSRSKPSAAVSALLTWRGRRPGWLFLLQWTPTQEKCCKTLAQTLWARNFFWLRRDCGKWQNIPDLFKSQLPWIVTSWVFQLIKFNAGVLSGHRH